MGRAATQAACAPHPAASPCALLTGLLRLPPRPAAACPGVPPPVCAAARPPAPAARDRGLPISGSSHRWAPGPGLPARVLACLLARLPPFLTVTTAPLPPPPLPAAAPRFEVHRLLLADSGTLLLCSVDTTGHLAALRKRLRQAYPGAPPRQSTIVHASIARLLDDGRQLAPAEIAAVQVRV